MSENDAPVATPSRQEAVTCASIARDKAAEIAVSGSGILVAVEIIPGRRRHWSKTRGPAHKQAVERQRARWHNQAPSARHQSRASWLAYRARSLAGLLAPSEATWPDRAI